MWFNRIFHQGKWTSVLLSLSSLLCHTYTETHSNLINLLNQTYWSPWCGCMSESINWQAWWLFWKAMPRNGWDGRAPGQAPQAWIWIFWAWISGGGCGLYMITVSCSVCCLHVVCSTRLHMKWTWWLDEISAAAKLEFTVLTGGLRDLAEFCDVFLCIRDMSLFFYLHLAI